ENERMGAFPRGRQAPFNQKFVESEFQEELRTRIARPRFLRRGCTPKVPAPAPVQSAEISVAAPVTKVVCYFSTEFSTAPVENFSHRPHRDSTPQKTLTKIKAAIGGRLISCSG